MAPNRNPAARLYAPVEHQHRPQETPPVEQGKAVVLSGHFFAACADGCRNVVALPGIIVVVTQRRLTGTGGVTE